MEATPQATKLAVDEDLRPAKDMELFLAVLKLLSLYNFDESRSIASLIFFIAC